MSAPAVSTCLWYDTQALEAARLYTSLFDGCEITDVMYKGGNPQNGAFTVAFTLQGQQYWALNGGPRYALTPAASISVHVDTQGEIDRLWAALLASGGQESRCGWLTDGFGLSWQILPRALPRLLQNDASGRVMTVMMAAVKCDIAALEAAAL
jgi:predicted 3-demethylubiquinone-9 3-methyltransferase (glyoxalase superfamily)